MHPLIQQLWLMEHASPGDAASLSIIVQGSSVSRFPSDTSCPHPSSLFCRLVTRKRDSMFGRVVISTVALALCCNNCCCCCSREPGYTLCSEIDVFCSFLLLFQNQSAFCVCDFVSFFFFNIWPSDIVNRTRRGNGEMRLVYGAREGGRERERCIREDETRNTLSQEKWANEGAATAVARESNKLQRTELPLPDCTGVSCFLSFLLLPLSARVMHESSWYTRPPCAHDSTIDLFFPPLIWRCLLWSLTRPSFDSRSDLTFDVSAAVVSDFGVKLLF